MSIKRILLLLGGIMLFSVVGSAQETRTHCAQPINALPPGWLPIQYFTDYTNNCGNYIGNTEIDENVGTLPSNSTVNVCIDAPLPNGWVEVSVIHSGNCDPNMIMNFDMQTIRLVHGLPIGTRVTICGQSTASLPKGWLQVSVTSGTDPNCGSGGT